MVTYTHYELLDPGGKVILSGSPAEIYEKNPDFLDENFSKSDRMIYVFDPNIFMRIGEGSQIVIRGLENGGVGEAGATFKLQYWFGQ